MTETMRDIFRRHHAPAADGVQTVNGAALRWMPGPDELRLPSCKAEPVSQNSRQAVVIEEGAGSLRLHWRGRPDVFVGADLFVYWHPKEPAAAPDVFVAFGVANRHRSSYVAWEEGKVPDFVLEVVSPSSGQRDENVKPDIYAKMGAQEYFWYDPLGKLAPPLAGFELRDGEYKPLPEQTLPGRVVGVRSKVLGLCLCIKPTGPEPLDVALCWYDPAAGEFLPARHEWAEGKRQAEARANQEAAQRKAAEARAEQEAVARAAAEARVAELEPTLRRSRADPPPSNH